jgi:hypothetical protein
MSNQINYSNSPRENFLTALLNKVINEYKNLLEHVRGSKPLRIIEIETLSNIPGDSKFTIQVRNKNSIAKLTAAEIISKGYSLNEFNDFHAEMIRQAALGKLINFLHQSDTMQPSYKIVSKKLDKEIQQYIFTIETKDQVRFIRTADELSLDSKLLSHMDINDIYDVGYTHGSESVLKERAALLLAKHPSK